MRSRRTQSHPTPDRAGVLSRAVVRAGAIIDLPQKDLARILGISPASATRIARGRGIDPTSKEGELAVLFLRFYRSLHALLGGDAANMRTWLHAQNHHLGGRPAGLLQSVEGLVRVVNYLDAMRGKV